MAEVRTFQSTIPKWLLGVSCAAIAACGGAVAGSGYGLAAAEHPACAQQGQILAQYLDTGAPTSLDPTYGANRQQVLTLSGDGRALMIRRTADAAIQQCDEELDVQASQSAAAASERAAQASASASASAAAALAEQVAAREQATCGQVGGTWQAGGGLFFPNSPGTCRVDYGSPADGRTHEYKVAFDNQGSVVPSDCADAAITNCLEQPQESVQQAPADCVSGAANYGSPGTWHSDTDICSS